MEYVIVAQVDSDVPHALRAGKTVTRGVGKEHEVAAFKVVEPDRRSLLHLRAGGDVEKHTRAFVIGVLRERRAVEFARHEIRIEYAVSPVIALTSPYVWVAEQSFGYPDDAFRAFGAIVHIVKRGIVVVRG